MCGLGLRGRGFWRGRSGGLLLFGRGLFCLVWGVRGCVQDSVELRVNEGTGRRAHLSLGCRRFLSLGDVSLVLYALGQKLIEMIAKTILELYWEAGVTGSRQSSTNALGSSITSYEGHRLTKAFLLGRLLELIPRLFYKPGYLLLHFDWKE